MNNEEFCRAYPSKESLISLVNDDCSLKQSIEFEAHLESCESCQQQIESLAGEEWWWTKTASLLSTIDELTIPAKFANELSAGSFVVPTLVDLAADKPARLSNHVFDWTQVLDPPRHPEMLGCIDQFEIESKLGQGGMGLVLKGFDRELNRAVAIKVLSPQLASNGTSRKRFAREAQAAAAVVHPNVIPIYSVNASRSRPYIVMQLVAGNSLQSLVSDHGPLPVREIVRIAIQVADGLAAAHQQGLIHRDIKPANVLTEQDVSRVVITDFGLARATDDAAMTRTGWIAGTPHYMSPEQAQGSTLDHRTDLFSLGGLLYFLATGREPFRAESPFAVIQKIINEQSTAPGVLSCDLPPLMSDIIEKLLEKRPQDRFQSADELRGVLKKYLAHLQQPQNVAKPGRLLTRRRRKTRRMWFGGLAASIVLAAAWLGYGQFNKFDSSQPTAQRFKTDPAITNPNIISDNSDSPTSAPIEGTDEHLPAIKIPPTATAISGEPPIVETPIRPPTNGSVFLDRSLIRELDQLNREIDQYELHWNGSNPLAIAPPSFPLDQSFSTEFRELENSLERYEQSVRALDSNNQLNEQPGHPSLRKEIK